MDELTRLRLEKRVLADDNRLLKAVAGMGWLITGVLIVLSSFGAI